MAITFRDEKGAPLTHEELDANFRSFFFTASYGANQLLLQRKDGTSLTVPIGGEAFADFQANGGSIGDVYIANSQVTGSRMIINLFSGSFYDKIKGPGSDGGNLNSDEWYITFNPQSSANYYVHFGSNFAISSSGYMHASGAVIEGNITASAGLIGGFNITPDAIVGPETLGIPSFYISGSASTSGYFISASAFNVKGNGEITGSDVLFTGGNIAGWDITNTQIRKSTNIVLDASDNSFSINSPNYGSSGIQLQYNNGTPRFHVGDGADSYVRYDGSDISISTRLLEISASNIEISSTEASMSLGGGNIKLLGGSSTIEVGTTNKVSITGGATDSFLVAGSKTTFGQNSTAGIIMGMDSNVPTFDLTKDANNYVRFDTTSGVDIKTDTFKLDTTYFDIDTSTQRLNIFDTASAEIIRLGEISDDASDLYGIKIFDGSGTGSAQTIAMFGQQGNKIGGWEVTDSQIRSIPNSGFGGTYAEGETGLIIHSDGRLESSNFVTNVKGWRIDTLGNGSAEFENMRIRGTLKTTVFEKESVNVVGGQLMVANATTIQPLRSEAGTIIAGSSSYADTAVTFSVANVSGFEVGEILKAKSVDDTGFSVEYMYVSGSKRYSQDGSISYNTSSIDPDGLAGEIYVQRAFGGVPAISSSVTTLAEDLDDVETDITVASTASLAVQNIIKINDERFKITSISSTGNVLTVIRDYHDTVADSHTNGATIYLIDNDKEFLAGLVSTAQPYNEGQVLVSTGVYNPEKDITSGYIVMNANPRDISTPYMDIVERTGSGVYDLQLRSRLGDLSGLSSAYLYGDDEPGFGIYTENGYFKGAITAQTGSIAGILHVATVQGGLETGQKISIGRDVQGTNDGIYVNNNNYWYTDGAWKVGGQNNYITLDNYTDGNLTIRTETFTLDTDNFIISSSLNSGTLKAGTNADIMTSTAETGIYMDGTGKFRVGTGTSGNNYIYWDGSTLNIKGSVDITGGTGATEAYVNTTATASISSSNAFTNASTASLSGSVATVTDTLDGKIFTDSSGRAVRPPTASATGLYLTSTNLGFYESGTWKTYMDNTGDFFLTGSAGNKLAWDADAGTLEIKGNITITGGNAATKDFVNTATGSLSGSLASSISSSNASLSDSIASNSSSLASDLSDLDAVASGKASIFRQGTSPSTSGRTVGDVWIHTGQQNKMYIWVSDQVGFAASSDGTYDQAALINSTSASLSSSIALDVFTDSSGKLVKTPNTSSAGLYLGDTNLGFYSGSEWKTYMADNGHFYLTGSESNYLVWDGTSLTIAGSINITSGNAATKDFVNTATGSLETYADNAASTAESNANSFTNLATASLSGSITSSLGAISASLANDVSASEAYTVYVSASQAAVNEATTGFLAGKNSIFRQDAEPTSSGRVDGDIWIDTNSTPANKVYVWATDQFIATPDGTYDQSSDINNLSGSVAADIFTDSSGKIVRTATLAGSGLFMDDTNLGYYANGEWKTFMSNNGNFFLTASNSDSYLAWQNGTLTVAGEINVVGGNAVTQDTLNTATGSLQTYADNAANEASSSLTGSINQAQQDATTASGTATQASQTAASASVAASAAQTTANEATASAASASAAASNVQSNLDVATGSLQTYANTAASVSASAAQTAAINTSTANLNASSSALEAFANNAAAEASQSLAGNLTGSISAAQTTANNANTAASASQATANQGVADAASAQSTANTAITRSVDANGKITFNPAPSGTGLIMNANNMGFYNNGHWGAYISASGDFYLSGSGNSGLSWDGTDLSVDGTIVARDGSIGGINLDADKMYIGTGTHDNSNTKFYVDDTGKFSLGDKLVWDGTNLTVAGSITITNATYATQADLDAATGSLETSISNTAATASAEAAAAQSAAEATANAALTTATSSLETSISNTAATASAEANAVQANLNTATGSLQTYANNASSTAVSGITGSIEAAQSTANTATGSAAAAQLTANAATASAATAQSTANAATGAAADVQSNLDTATGSLQTYANNAAGAAGAAASSSAINYTVDNYVSQATTSSLVNPTEYSFGGSGFDFATSHTPASGLNLTANHMGYHNGTSYTSFLSSSGEFFLTGTGNDGLIWSNNTLRIGNRGVGPTITYQFSGSLDENIFDSNIPNITTYTSPVLGVLLQNSGGDAWNKGFHTKAVFDRNDGPTFEWDIVVGHNSPATMIGLFKENPSSYSHTQQYHTVYFQSNAVTVRENGTQLTSLASSDWTSDNDFSENQQYRVKITLLETGARYEIYKDGDFTSPAYTYQSAANGVTNQYVRPGASILYDNSTTTQGLIFRGMAAGAQLGAATKISGNTIQTGKILSSNHSGTSDGSAMSTTGMAIDLDNGAISAKNFRIASDGSAVFTGTMQIGGTTLDANNTLNANTTATDVGLGNVDNVSNSQIQATASAAANTADKTAGTVGGWTIHSDKIFTGTDENVDTYTSTAGRLIISSSGAIHSKSFYMDKNGNAGFRGTVTIGSTDLTENNTLNSNTAASDVSGLAAVATSGDAADVGLGNVDNVSNSDIQATASAAANAADKTDGSVGGWTIHSDKIFTGADENTATFTSAAGRLIISSSGAIHSKEFYIDKAGNAKFKGDLEAAGGTFAGSLRVGTTNTSVSDVVSGAADGASSLQPGDAASDVNNNSTTISGNKIRTGAILSNNHSGTADGSGFSTAGSAIDLTNGGLSFPRFAVSASGATFFGGTITAEAGMTGSLIRGARIEAGSLNGAEIVGGAVFVPDASNPNFAVSSDGFMTASDANISGEITATSGQIGDWVIDANTNALRDSDSEVIFSPDPAEIQMYSGGDKKVIIAPTADLTSTAGGSVSVAANTGNITMPSATSVSPYYDTTATQNGSLGSGTFTPSSAGDYTINVTTPSFSVLAPSGNQTVSVAYPSYEGTYENQKHGFITSAARKKHAAYIYLDAVKTSDNTTVIGSVFLGYASATVGRNSFTYYYASGSDDSSGGNGLQSVQSVAEDTEIELYDGTIKLAKDITKEDRLRVWDWIDSNNFIEGEISETLNTVVPEYIIVETETKKLKVSFTHGFWLDGNKQAKAPDLVPGVSEIYIIKDNQLVKEKVIRKEIVHEKLNVFTFKIPKYTNYISNGVLSHNPTGTVYTWVSSTAGSSTSAQTVFHSGTTNEEFTLNISEASPFKFRYRVVSYARSGQNVSVSSTQSTTYTNTHTTTQGFNTDPSFDGSVSVAVPTNFVEIKAGGIQIVSDATQYVKMPRLAQGSAQSATILEAVGGTVVTNAVRPNSNGTWNLGGSSYRWNNVFSEAGNFSGGVSTGALTVTGAITATGNITAFYSSDKRLKENIINLDGSLAKVLKLRGTRFDWKEGNEEIHPYEGNDIGFIAQEVKEILPEVVGQMHGGYYGVRYEKLTPILVEAIKELSKKVDILEQKLKDKE